MKIILKDLTEIEVLEGSNLSQALIKTKDLTEVSSIGLKLTRDNLSILELTSGIEKLSTVNKIVAEIFSTPETEEYVEDGVLKFNTYYITRFTFKDVDETTLLKEQIQEQKKALLELAALVG